MDFDISSGVVTLHTNGFTQADVKLHIASLILVRVLGELTNKLTEEAVTLNTNSNSANHYVVIAH
ncbi:hypothetical protein DGG96_07260 [Legionella qingyii]|uniref:Uncharacterized protein n=1 Tax=Legionella qingyii TaxID=2184757 RepID=A0A317U2M2_9GAMM|nr:hypothetical protein DGG96_07260 [Legionella qingyii]